MKTVLTVFFEEPFWVGIFEREEGDFFFISKVIFGSEPKDYEVYGFIQQNYLKLRFGSSHHISEKKEEKKLNPIRMQREAKKMTEKKGISTKSQLALKLDHELHKIERKKQTRQEKEEEALRKFELKQAKKLKKHKGH